MDNTCFIQLLNNYRVTHQELAKMTGLTYCTARNRIINMNLSFREARILSKHFNIPLEDMGEIIDGNKEVLKRHLIKI